MRTNTENVLVLSLRTGVRLLATVVENHHGHEFPSSICDATGTSARSTCGRRRIVFATIDCRRASGSFLAHFTATYEYYNLATGATTLQNKYNYSSSIKNSEHNH